MSLVCTYDVILFEIDENALVACKYSTLYVNLFEVSRDKCCVWFSLQWFTQE